MSRKRRMFDIEMPEEETVEARPAGPRISTLGERRAPMASAVRENAEALRARAEAEKAIRAENDALAHEYVRLRDQGLVMRRVPVGEVRTSKLTRDRRDLDPEGLGELQESIRAIGLSNPIQVEETGQGYELVQGLRRLTAYRTLHEETGASDYAEIPAVVLAEGDTLDRLYRRMVDENMIRTDISFAEMAGLARAYVEDPGTEAETLDDAVAALFGSAGKQKRSYIRAFARLLAVLDKHLEHPEAIPRALGLAVRKRMEAEPETIATLQRALMVAGPRSVEEELGVLREYAGEVEAPAETGQGFPAGNRSSQPKRPARRARTTFQVTGGLGTLKCTASQGRLELRGEADFSAIDRRRLEEALQRFLDDLAG